MRRNRWLGSSMDKLLKYYISVQPIHFSVKPEQIMVCVVKDETLDSIESCRTIFIVNGRFELR